MKTRLKKLKGKIFVKYLQTKLKFSTLKKNTSNRVNKIVKGFINIKYNILNNLTNYKALSSFILKIIAYGAILFCIAGAIWGYSLSIFGVSVASYLLYETILLEDVPETIIKIGNSINGDKK